tara:strand:- start:41 stop:265 length:225 start_codon:yes stop_codon:yes gene_type:complete
MKKLSLEIKDIADKLNSKQGDLDMVHQLRTLVSNYNFLYKDFDGTTSKCVLDGFQPVFYTKCWLTDEFVEQKNS